MARSPDTIVIASNHHLDTGSGFLDVLQERNLPYSIVNLKRGFPDTLKMGGLIALGSPLINSPDQIAWYNDVADAGVPGIGVCVALQGLGTAKGGYTRRAPEPEIGFVDRKGIPFRPRRTIAGLNDPVLGGSLDIEQGAVFEFHSDELVVRGGKVRVLARNRHGGVQSIRTIKNDGTLSGLIGTQFHPEVGTRRHLKKFIQIYRDVFRLTSDKEQVLYGQFEEFEKSNVGPVIVERAIDTIENAGTFGTKVFRSAA